MSEHATPDGGHDNPSMHQLHNVMTGTSWVDRALGITEGVLNSPLGHGAHEVLHHSAPNLVPFLGAMLGPLGMVAGGGEAVMGIDQAMHSGGQKQADGIVGALQGGAGIISGAGSTLAAMGAFPAAGAIGTGFAGTGLTAGAAAGPLAAAAAVGLGTGGLIAHHMNGNYVDGFFGRDDSGRQRDSFDWAADQGIAAESSIQSALGIKEGGDGFFNTIGDKTAGVIGGGVAGLLGIGSAFAGLGAEAVHGVSNAASGFGAWMENGVRGIYQPSMMNPLSMYAD